MARSPDQSSYPSGTVVTVTATPTLGYTFTGWSGDLTGTTNPTTITMDANKTVTATFSPALVLSASWNLVTVPLDSTTLSGLAGDINFTGEIYGYSQTTGWFIPAGFEAGQGYWLNMKAAGTATVYGYEVASPQLTNYASGWVLIGSPYSVGGDTVRVVVGVNPPMLLEDAVASTFIGNIFYFNGTWGPSMQPPTRFSLVLDIGLKSRPRRASCSSSPSLL